MSEQDASAQDEPLVGYVFVKAAANAGIVWAVCNSAPRRVPDDEVFYDGKLGVRGVSRGDVSFAAMGGGKRLKELLKRLRIPCNPAEQSAFDRISGRRTPLGTTAVAVEEEYFDALRDAGATVSEVNVALRDTGAQRG